MEADPSLAPHRASFDTRYGGSCRGSDLLLEEKKGQRELSANLYATSA
jgi:hypothetical protein